MILVAGGGKGWKFCDFSRDESTRVPKSVSAETLVRKLRWATVGIQFDWSKVLCCFQLTDIGHILMSVIFELAPVEVYVF